MKRDPGAWTSSNSANITFWTGWRDETFYYYVLRPAEVPSPSRACCPAERLGTQTARLPTEAIFFGPPVGTKGACVFIRESCSLPAVAFLPVPWVHPFSRRPGTFWLRYR